MSRQAIDAVIAQVYEAAMNKASWDDCLIGLADALQASQTAMYVMRGDAVVAGSMPLMDDADLRVVKQMREQDSNLYVVDPLRRAKIGKTVGFEDPKFRDGFTRSLEYREWWREHNLGTGSLFTNLALNDNGQAQLAIYRPCGQSFSARERANFETVCGHFARAARIQRRLQVAAAGESARSPRPPRGQVIIGENGSILSEDQSLVELLRSLGVVTQNAFGSARLVRNSPLGRLVAAATDDPATGGSILLANDRATVARLDVAPISRGHSNNRIWLELDRPAALVHLSRPHERITAGVQGLTIEYGLTPAEAAVAEQISIGDGRAAVAERLGISESTVRSHLTAVFDKVGVRRQSELVRLLGV